MFTDLGKSGPLEATEPQAQLIADMYAEDALLKPSPTEWTVRRFLEMYMMGKYPDVTETLKTLEEIGVSEDMSMRDFYNLHAGWSYDLIRNETAIPEEAKVMAALHHILEGVNPENLVDLTSDTFMIPSLGRSVDQRELWVLLFDKYQARSCRGGVTEEQAIEWLRGFVDKFGVKLQPYPEWLKTMLHECIDQMEAMVTEEENFIVPRSASSLTADAELPTK